MRTCSERLRVPPPPATAITSAATMSTLSPRSSATSRRDLLPVLSVLEFARHISPSIGPTRNRLTLDQKREREDLSR